MSASSTTARCSRRNTSRTSSSSFRTSAKSSPIGDKRDFVAVMINIDLDRGRKLGRAQQRRLRLLSGARRPSAGLRHDRATRRRGEPLTGARQGDGGRADQALPDPAQGARCRRRRTDAHPEGAPRLHRRSLCPLVKALYDGSEEADISTEVTFEDGRKGTISARVKIRDMKTDAGRRGRWAKRHESAERRRGCGRRRALVGGERIARRSAA